MGRAVPGRWSSSCSSRSVVQSRACRRARPHSDAATCRRRYDALSLWMDPSEETDAAHFAWAKALASDLAPNTTTGVYLNFT